jgi:lipoyl(octanoyl) transferase
LYICGMQTAIFEDLGIVGYQDAWDFQERLLQENVSAKMSLPAKPTVNHLLFCAHPPVYTLGKSGQMEHVLINEKEREEKGIGFYKTNRGGDITFHGPGQLVAYPILDLEHFGKDIGKYLRNLEQVIIDTLADYGLKGDRSPGETGVWLDPDVKGRERKICAMGVRCSRWITMHGLALNMNTNLEYFNFIIPCGISQKQVTSLAKELDRSVDEREVKDNVKRHFETIFGLTLAPAGASNSVVFT